MRIAIFHELDLGGALRVVVQHTNYLREKHEVEVWTTKHSSAPMPVPQHVHSFVYPASRHKLLSRLVRDTWDLHRLFRLHQKIAAEIAAWNPDVVYLHPSSWTQAPLLLLALPSHLKKIYFCQEPLRQAYDPEVKKEVSQLSGLHRAYEKSIRTWRKMIDRLAVKHADWLLVNSQFSQQNVMRAYGLPSTVVYLGVDADFFVLPSKKHPRPIDLLFLGNPEYLEGYELFEQVQTRLPGLRTQVLSRKNAAPYSDTDLRNTLQQSLIVLCLSRNEPFGLVPLEAMACGAVVIAMAEGGYVESVQAGETGFLVPRQIDALVNKIEAVVSNSHLRQEIQKKAREIVESRWTWKQSGKAVEKVIHSIVTLNTNQT